MPSSKGSSQPRDRTQVSRIAGGFFTSWTIGEAQTAFGSFNIADLRKIRRGLPWQFSGYDFTFQSRGCGLDPWSYIELRSYMPQDQKTKTETRSNVVKTYNEDLKNGPHQKNHQKAKERIRIRDRRNGPFLKIYLNLYPLHWTCIPCIERRILIHCTTRQAQNARFTGKDIL